MSNGIIAALKIQHLGDNKESSLLCYCAKGSRVLIAMKRTPSVSEGAVSGARKPIAASAAHTRLAKDIQALAAFAHNHAIRYLTYSKFPILISIPR
jgi:hypothetical protein